MGNWVAIGGVGGAGCHGLRRVHGLKPMRKHLGDLGHRHRRVAPFRRDCRITAVANLHFLILLAIAGLAPSFLQRIWVVMLTVSGHAGLAGLSDEKLDRNQATGMDISVSGD